MGQRAYLHVRDWSRVRGGHAGCLRCAATGCRRRADYFQIMLDPFFVPVGRGRDAWYCAEHMCEVAAMSRQPVFEHYDEALAAVTAAQERRRQEDRARSGGPTRRDEELQRDGRSLLMTGKRGQLYVLPAGRFAIRRKGSAQLEPVCCWRRGAHLIGVPQPADHVIGCPGIRAEQPGA